MAVFDLVLVQADAAPSEYQVKAALLFNIARYVEWPTTHFPGKDAPFVIGIFGEDPSKGVFQTMLEDASLKDRKVKVVIATTLEELKACQLVFIGRQEGESLKRVLKLIDNFPVLTIGEAEGFVASGGAIRLITGKESVRFKIDVDVIDRHGLKVSSHLLRLEKAVVMRSGKEVLTR